MASIWQHPNSTFWKACYPNKDGKQVKPRDSQTPHKAADKAGRGSADLQQPATALPGLPVGYSYVAPGISHLTKVAESASFGADEDLPPI